MGISLVRPIIPQLFPAIPSFPGALKLAAAGIGIGISSEGFDLAMSEPCQMRAVRPRSERVLPAPGIHLLPFVLRTRAI
jgi:hypothetical protein